MYYTQMDSVDAGFCAMSRLILVRLTNLVTRRYQKYSRYHKVTIKGQVVRRPRKTVEPQLTFTAYQETPDRLKHISCNDRCDYHGVWYFFACREYRYQGRVIFRDDKITVSVTTETDSADTDLDLSDPDCIDKVIEFFKKLLPVSDPSCPYRLIKPGPARTRTKRGGTASCSK